MVQGSENSVQKQKQNAQRLANQAIEKKSPKTKQKERPLVFAGLGNAVRRMLAFVIRNAAIRERVDLSLRPACVPAYCRALYPLFTPHFKGYRHRTFPEVPHNFTMSLVQRRRAVEWKGGWVETWTTLTAFERRALTRVTRCASALTSLSPHSARCTRDVSTTVASDRR